MKPLSECSSIEEVQNRLQEMFEADQNARTLDDINLYSSIDVRNTSELQTWIAKHGFPSKHLYGRKAYRNAWLIVQHATHDIPFMKEVLPLLDQDSYEYAYLYDRLVLFKGLPQKYATQSLEPPRPPCLLDYNQARESVGLPWSPYMMDKVIVALDVDTKVEAIRISNWIAKDISHIKIGSRLFTQGFGRSLCERFADMGFRIFLDLKFHDIPSVVGAACKAAENLPGVFMCTVHTQGGMAMMQSALGNSSLNIVGVSTLTSNEASIKDLQDQANLAKEAGIQGLVCSGHDIAHVKEVFPEALIVTPGIRLPGDDTGDQLRVCTPREALEAGSDYLVMGRSILSNRTEKGVKESLQRLQEHICS